MKRILFIVAPLVIMSLVGCAASDALGKTRESSISMESASGTVSGIVSETGGNRQGAGNSSGEQGKAGSMQGTVSSSAKQETAGSMKGSSDSSGKQGTAGSMQETGSSSGASRSPGGQNASTPVFTSSGIKGKIHDIYYGHGSQVIVSADKLYLYDLEKGSTQIEIPLPLSAVTDIRPINNGYVVIGENQDSSGSGSGMMSSSETQDAKGIRGTQCIFYDTGLNKTLEISLSQLVRHHSVLFSDQIGVSKEGDQLVFSTNEGLYLYEINKKETSLVMDMADDPSVNKGIVAFTNLQFTNSGKSIVFLASSFDVPSVPDQQSFPTIGMVNTDGTGLVNKKAGDFSLFEMPNAYDTFALFGEDFRSPTGRILKMDIPSGKTSFLAVDQKAESSAPFGSLEGTYYATSKVEGKNWMIRIYETDTGKLVSEQEVPWGEEVYSIRSPKIKLIDQTRTCIVLVGQTQQEFDTKVFVNSF